MWTLEMGIGVARLVQSVVERYGAHVGITGGVLIRGESMKDLDILIYPRDAFKGYCIATLQKELGRHFTNWFQCTNNSNYIRDSKEVWTVKFDGKRIDFFFLMADNKENQEIHDEYYANPQKRK